jgi:dolichyl-phosphate-mannose-protein mannosyltransferase
MVLCENSYTTISRFILLDSMLLFGTVATVFCWSKFHRQQKYSFEPEWFFWLFMTGLSLGFVCSIKLVGLFVTAMVGLYTIEDLWNKFGNTKMSYPVLAAHISARVVGLIVIPLLVYLFSFALHFAILTRSGPGDAQMSSLFQANLEGSEIGRNSPLEVALGSKVTIKNMGYGGGLLHSHVQSMYLQHNTERIPLTYIQHFLRARLSNKLHAITTKTPTMNGGFTQPATKLIGIPTVMLNPGSSAMAILFV